MNPELFSAKNVIVQGITGQHGTFHTGAMREAGTRIVAGTSPTKAGTKVDNIPVYPSIAAIQQAMPVDASVIFVPARFAKSAILEAIDAAIPLIVCITEGIPVHDMLEVRKRLLSSTSVLIGPNCPGILLPGSLKLGIIPANLGLAGDVGVVSRSGTLTYEVMAGLSKRGIGQRYVIGIGGDPIKGASFVDCLKLFEADPLVTSIVLVGEIGGQEEIETADFITQHVTKPVYSYVVGHHAPKGVQLGHAGAILSNDDESAAAKTEALARAGASTFTSVTELILATK